MIQKPLHWARLYSSRDTGKRVSKSPKIIFLAILFDITNTLHSDDGATTTNHVDIDGTCKITQKKLMITSSLCMECLFLMLCTQDSQKDDFWDFAHSSACISGTIDSSEVLLVTLDRQFNTLQCTKVSYFSHGWFSRILPNTKKPQNLHTVQLEILAVIINYLVEEP